MPSNNTITTNRRATYEYSLIARYEAGLMLSGWEVKSIRAGRLQLNQGYVIIKNGEAWLIGAQISPLTTASTHVNPDPERSRKLLLHRKEIDKLYGLISQRGLALVPLTAYWQRNKIKLSIGLAKGKKLHDKRATEKQRDWAKQKQQLLKKSR
jgi:SsrA-binding protein